MDLTVPPNSSATLRLPTAQQAAITESGRPLSQSAAVSVVKIDSRVATLRVGAGTYHFSVTR